MSKFNVGDKVFVTGSTFYPNHGTSSFIGKFGWVMYIYEDAVIVYNEDRTDWFAFNESDLQHATETPKEITLNGATYVLKEEPKPDHEWKFGDIAVHEEYGVGIVFSKPDYENDVRFAYNDDWDWADIKELTFLRRADLSV